MDMTNLAKALFLGFGLLVPLIAGAAGVISYPGDGACENEREDAYEDGYDRGRLDCAANPRGCGVDCAADPESCGVTYSDVIPDATFGETEPNDSLITADPLTLEANFWGQLYSNADQDWFWTETTQANQNLVLNFSVPWWLVDEAAGQTLMNGAPGVWNVSVRDAAGNVFANFNTNVPGSIESQSNSVTYNVTLGLVGTYYIVVRAVDESDGATLGGGNQYPYSVATFIQDTHLENDQGIAGFYDAEIEPNDIPSLSTPIASGVSMYGLINLTFDSVVGGSDSKVWAQGENDWYVYHSDGNELITLVLCAKAECGPGDWMIEIYDHYTANQIEAGASREAVTPLFSTNTDNTDNPSAVYQLGLRDPGFYYLRINHKRLFTAPCVAYQTDLDNNGLIGPNPQACACDGGGYSCTNNILNPAAPNETVDNETGEVTKEYEPCPDGSGGGDSSQCEIGCLCTEFSGVVEIPENEVSSTYNFTWHGTQLPANTIDTDAYEDYLDRPNPYTP